MSFNVFVIPEDATKDHYVLKPVIRALVSAAGRPRAVVKVLSDPAAHGIDQVLKPDFLQEVFFRNSMTTVFLLCVDRDGKSGRQDELAHREVVMASHLVAGQRFLGTAAHQEVEAWCLAGLEGLPRDWSWKDVRDEPDCKEVYFERFARECGVAGGPGGGRESLGREAARRYSTIKQKCPEVALLEERVRALTN